MWLPRQHRSQTAQHQVRSLRLHIVTTHSLTLLYSSIVLRVGTGPQYPDPARSHSLPTRSGRVNGFETPTNIFCEMNLVPTFLFYTYLNSGPARPRSNSDRASSDKTEPINQGFDIAIVSLNSYFQNRYFAEKYFLQTLKCLTSKF